MRRRNEISFLLIMMVCRMTAGQLVLDDVSEDLLDEPTEVVAVGQPQNQATGQATDPYTKILQWGVDNMDRASVAEQAKAIREGRMKPKAFDREVMDLIFGSKINFLQKAVNELIKAKEANDPDELVTALENLEEQITDIDNAGDLDTIGGLRPTLDLLTHPNTKVRQTAFWVIGTTVQSNPKMQDLVFSYGVLPTIMEPIAAAAASGPGAAAAAGVDPHVLSKNLYALSALLRGCGACLADFARRGGGGDLAALLAAMPPDGAGPAWLPPRRKAVALIGDLVREESSPAAVAALAAAFTSPSAAGGEAGAAVRPAAAVQMLPQLRSADKELQEKTLEALLSLLSAAPAASSVLAAAAAAGEVAALRDRTLSRMGAAHPSVRAAAAPAASAAASGGGEAEAAADEAEGGEGGGAWEQVLLLANSVLHAIPNATGPAQPVQ